MKLLYVKFTLIITVIALVITIIACNRNSLLKGVNVEIGTQLLYSPVNVQIIDANLDGTIPQNITVSIIGKDKDKIYSVFGEKAITVNDQGFLNLGIPRNNTASIDAPIEFIMVINAPGYLEARKNFIVTDLKKNIFENVRMVNLSSPPKGVSISSDVVISVDATKGVMQDISFSTPSAIGKTENASVKVLAGTKMFDKDGNPITGDVKVSLVHFDAVNASSLINFPGGFYIRNARDGSGNSLANDKFITFGFMAMRMTVNGNEVKTFSQPLYIQVDINPNNYRPTYNRVIQAGDTIPIWSLGDTSTQWKGETFGVVTNNNGKLKISYKQQHLSVWSVCDFSCYRFYWAGELVNGKPVLTWYPIRICKNCNISDIKILSNYTTDKYFVFAVGYDVGIYKNYSYCCSSEINVKNGTTLDFDGLNTGGFNVFNLKFYDDYNYGGPEVLLDYLSATTPSLYTTEDIYVCNKGITLDLRGALPPPPPTINLNFSGLCGGATPESANAIIQPSVDIMYKEIGVNINWKYLGHIQDGKGSTTGLMPGHRYKFKISYGSLKVTTDDLGLKDGFLMPNGDATIAVKSTVYGVNQTFTITKDVANNSYNLNYLNFPVPDKLCAEYQNYFR